jgi:1-deoxy-D-xylulose-5-phosphate reductoisomerase
LAREVMRTRGLTGAAFNAAKEIALDHFIAGKLAFLEMAAVVEGTLDRLSGEIALGAAIPDLDAVLATDQLARVRADELARARHRNR